MDASSNVGALGGNGPLAALTATAANVPPQPAITKDLPNAGTAAALSPSSNTALPPTVVDSPSPTPAAIASDEQHLPASIKYAPSPAPKSTEGSRFDRTA